MYSHDNTVKRGLGGSEIHVVSPEKTLKIIILTIVTENYC
jgi:hypothetical protein